MKILIISYFFPPCAGGGATLMYNLCKHLPRDNYTVITTETELFARLGKYDKEFTLECDTVRLPVRKGTRQDYIRFILLTIFKGLRLNKKQKYDCFLAVYPNIYNLLGAYILHKLTRKTFAIYMHDLFSENLSLVSSIKRGIWQSLERRVLSATSGVLVVNERFRDHYLKRGISNVMVLPPSIDLDGDKCDSLPSRQSSKGSIRIVFTGSVYGAHEKAVLAFLKAVEVMPDVEVLFATPSTKNYLKRVSVGFLSKEECIKLQRSADVLFLPLSPKSQYLSEELDYCFPSKVLEYLAAGKPILAVVPKRSFMDDFIKKHDVGIVVTEASPKKIFDAIEELKDENKRRAFSRNALKTVRLFDSRIRSQQLYSLLNDIITICSNQHRD